MWRGVSQSKVLCGSARSAGDRTVSAAVAQPTGSSRGSALTRVGRDRIIRLSDCRAVPPISKLAWHAWSSSPESQMSSSLVRANTNNWTRSIWHGNCIHYTARSCDAIQLGTRFGKAPTPTTSFPCMEMRTCDIATPSKSKCGNHDGACAGRSMRRNGWRRFRRLRWLGAVCTLFTGVRVL